MRRDCALMRGKDVSSCASAADLTTTVTTSLHGAGIHRVRPRRGEDAQGERRHVDTQKSQVAPANTLQIVSMNHNLSRTTHAVTARLATGYHPNQITFPLYLVDPLTASPLAPSAPERRMSAS